jgi:hypothetical protein
MPRSPRYASGGVPSIARQTDGETEERLRPEPVPSGLHRGGIEEHGVVGAQGLGRSVPEGPPKHLQDFSGYLASHPSRSGFGLSRPSGLAWTVTATARRSSKRLARHRDEGSPTQFVLREAVVGSLGRKLVERLTALGVVKCRPAS